MRHLVKLKGADEAIKMSQLVRIGTLRWVLPWIRMWLQLSELLVDRRSSRFYLALYTSQVNNGGQNCNYISLDCAKTGYVSFEDKKWLAFRIHVWGNSHIV